MDEDDIAAYTIKCIDDPRALNKTIYLRPQENILSQNELIAKWEKLSGKVLKKIPIPSDEFLASMKGKKNHLFVEYTVFENLSLLVKKWWKGDVEFLGKHYHFFMPSPYKGNGLIVWKYIFIVYNRFCFWGVS